MISTTTRRAMDPLADVLGRAGFVAGEEGVFSRDGTDLRTSGGWATLERDLANGQAGPLDGPVRPGLWKPVRCGGAGRLRFELPLTVLAANVDAEDTWQILIDSLAWALATGDGSVPAGWEAPEVDQEVWADRLVFQHGRHAVRGRLVQGAGALAVHVPLARALPADGAWRGSWLGELLQDAQDRWRMVRFAASDESAARAEIDLTGAPAGAVESLLVAGLDALRGCVAWLADALDLLADEAVSPRALQAVEVRQGSLDWKE